MDDLLNRYKNLNMVFNSFNNGPEDLKDSLLTISYSLNLEFKQVLDNANIIKGERDYSLFNSLNNVGSGKSYSSSQACLKDYCFNEMVKAKSNIIESINDYLIESTNGSIKDEFNKLIKKGVTDLKSSKRFIELSLYELLIDCEDEFFIERVQLFNYFKNGSINGLSSLKNLLINSLESQIELKAPGLFDGLSVKHHDFFSGLSGESLSNYLGKSFGALAVGGVMYGCFAWHPYAATASIISLGGLLCGLIEDDDERSSDGFLLGLPLLFTGYGGYGVGYSLGRGIDFLIKGVGKSLGYVSGFINSLPRNIKKFFTNVKLRFNQGKEKDLLLDRELMLKQAFDQYLT